MPDSGPERLPGFWRRFRITPADGRVSSELEDDFHCMSLLLHHADGIATALEPAMQRAPWTTCPGALSQLQRTFTGKALDDFPRLGQKTANCTHLYDLALLAAAHARDAQPLVYDVLVADPVEGRRRAELRRNGIPILGWVEQGMRILEPEEVAGLELLSMQAWVQSLDPERQEAARVLRWGNLIANGRSIPLAQQSDATRLPPSCYSFQPERAALARRVGEIRDFSKGLDEPLGERHTAL